MSAYNLQLRSIRKSKGLTIGQLADLNDFGSQDGLSGVEQKQDLTQSENYRPQELLYWSPQPCDVMVFKQPKEHVQTQTYDARERM